MFILTLSTVELEAHVRGLYKKIEHVAKKEGIYGELSVHFAECTPYGRPGTFCYSDGTYYYCGGIGDRGLRTTSLTAYLM